MGRIFIYIVASWAGETGDSEIGSVLSHMHTHIRTALKRISSSSPFYNIEFALLLKLLEFALSARKLRYRKVK